MNSNRVPRKLKPAVDTIVESTRSIADLFENQEWSILLILLIVTAWILFRPEDGLISKDILPSPTPIIYSQIFWLSELFLILSVALWEGFKRIVDKIKHRTESSNSRSALTKFFITASVVAIVTLFGFDAVSSSLLQSRPFPSNYLKCGISGDCLSWGENVLMIHHFEDEELTSSWQQKCKNHWRQKAAAVSLYGTSESKDALNLFEVHCSNDAETQIYLNNVDVISNSRPIISGRNPISIAVSLPVSREGGEEESQEILRGVAVAQREVNENGGISDGRKLLVLIADDGFSIEGGREVMAARVKNVAEGIRGNSEVLGVVGHFTSDATEFASEKYSEDLEGIEKLIAVSPTSTAKRKLEGAEGINVGDYVFRTALNDGLVAKNLANLIAQENYNKVAIVSESESSYSDLFLRTFSEEFEREDGQILEGNECVFDKGRGNIEDIARECLSAAAENREAEDKYALLLVPSTKSSKLIQPIIMENFLNPEYRFELIGADSMYSQKFAQESTEGMKIYVPWHQSSEISNFKNQSVKDDYFSKLFNLSEIEVTWRTAMAYDASQVLIQGIKEASAEHCSNPFPLVGNVIDAFDPEQYRDCIRRNILEAVSSPDNPAKSITGNDINFDEYGDREPNPSELGVLVTVAKVEDGYDFVPEI